MGFDKICKPNFLLAKTNFWTWTQNPTQLKSRVWHFQPSLTRLINCYEGIPCFKILTMQAVQVAPLGNGKECVTVWTSESESSDQLRSTPACTQSLLVLIRTESDLQMAGHGHVLVVMAALAPVVPAAHG